MPPKIAAPGSKRGARHPDPSILPGFDAVGPSLMLVCPDALSPDEYQRLRAFLPDARVHEISREESLGYDTNALQVNDRIIAPMSLSKGSEDEMRRLGLKVERLDLSELFMKGGGAPVCLTNRMWGLRLDEAPDAARWSLRPTIEAHE
jgi:N-dimethylarginine dimethylaminohydrolase